MGDEPVEHPFWDVQPVAKTNADDAHQIRLIDPKQVPDQCIATPDFIQFQDVPVGDEATLDELFNFLAGHYV